VRRLLIPSGRCGKLLPFLTSPSLLDPLLGRSKGFSKPSPRPYLLGGRPHLLHALTRLHHRLAFAGRFLLAFPNLRL
jgi:hypothetical protein